MIINVVSYLERLKDSTDIAAADGRSSYSYRRLWEQASCIGAALSARVGQDNRPVMVSIDRDASCIAAFMGVLMSGNFYVPVDPSLPAERLRAMCSVIEPAAVIGKKGDTFCPQGVPYIAEFPENGGCDGWKKRKDTDPVYVIFTSGSTGVPKGVAVSHRSVIDMAEHFTDVFGIEKGSVFGNQAPFDFDVSVKDIYISLCTGGRVEVLEKVLFSFPKLLIERLNERRVDTAVWAVPAFKLPAAVKAFDSERPRYLKRVMFSGETMPSSVMSYLLKCFPETEFVNLYGPTEITCNCTYHRVERDMPEDAPIPIGKAFPNCSVFLMDGDEPVDRLGIPAEICVSGSCLALGYYNMPEQTEKAFVINPANSRVFERMYRTGDIGELLPDGSIVYKGRRDNQIKHMGHRIELSEIELAANACGADESACVYDAEKGRIVLFYRGEDITERIVSSLRDKLPSYMLPKTVIRLDTFPVTRTGKTDRKALARMI